MACADVAVPTPALAPGEPGAPRIRQWWRKTRLDGGSSCRNAAGLAADEDLAVWARIAVGFGLAAACAAAADDRRRGRSPARGGDVSREVF